MVNRTGLRTDTALRDATQLPGILVTNQVVTTWNCLSNMNLYGNYSSPCVIFFSAQLAFFSVLPLFLTHDELYIFRRLVCIAYNPIQAFILCLGRRYFFPLRSFSLLRISRSAGGRLWLLRLLLLES